MRNSITTRFFCWFAALSILFLVTGSALALRTASSDFVTRFRDQLHVEAQSAATIASQSYSIGDLVAMRTALTQLSLAGSWSKAAFINTNGEIIWSSEPATSPGEGGNASGLTAIVGALAAWCTPSQTFFTITMPVTMTGGASLGKVTIEKGITGDRGDFIDQIMLTLASFASFWLVFVVLATTVVARIVFRPILSLKQAIGDEAEKHAIALSSRRNGDELRQIEDSFKELATAWVDARREVIRIEKLAAVAGMTQMLAHDVRKPFSILKMGLTMLGNAKDPAGVKRVLSRLVPEIDKAVSSVDGLISDVMEVGSTSSQLIQEPASPEAIIEATLDETFRIYPKSKIAIAYDLGHRDMVNVHVQKVRRVFSNIVGNAVQAMKCEGAMWFKTREYDGWTEFRIGNSGSSIPPESLPKLFDAFFTSGKKGGTGLGLAIAQKVVQAHGGKIWCESDRTPAYPEGMVEFCFTLPVAMGHRCKTTDNLPANSSEVMQALLAPSAQSEGDPSVAVTSPEKGELTLEVEIIEGSRDRGRPFRVLIIDDESVYRSAVASYLARTTELTDAVAVVQADGSAAAMAAANQGAFDLIVTDVDMGPESLDGFELIRAFRSTGVPGLICVHSNRVVAADHKAAIEAGANVFIPKSMARPQLLRLLLQTVVCEGT